MKPWRERIAEARERGRFSSEDRVAWGSPDTCMVGEQRERYGMDFPLSMLIPEDEIPRKHFDRFGALLSLQGCILRSISRNDFNAAEALLDAIENQALNLKRQCGESQLVGTD